MGAKLHIAFLGKGNPEDETNDRGNGMLMSEEPRLRDQRSPAVKGDASL